MFQEGCNESLNQYKLVYCLQYCTGPIYSISNCILTLYSATYFIYISVIPLFTCGQACPSITSIWASILHQGSLDHRKWCNDRWYDTKRPGQVTDVQCDCVVVTRVVLWMGGCTVLHSSVTTVTWYNTGSLRSSPWWWWWTWWRMACWAEDQGLVSWASGDLG
jgi:hypothetical protein